ncbi:MAG: hypothetical protein ACQES2_04900 [Pseudomonadota bacterium]
MTYITTLEANQLQAIAQDMADQLAKMPHKPPVAQEALANYIMWKESIESPHRRSPPGGHDHTINYPGIKEHK